MNMGILDVMDGVTTALVENGARAAVDATQLNPPCVWVSLGLVSPDLLDGNGRVQLVLYAIVPDTSYVAVVRALDELLAKVNATVDIDGDVTPQSVVLPGPSTATLPALRITAWVPYTRMETE